MELKVKMKLNSMTEIEAVFDGADLQDVVRNAGVFLSFDGKCGMCDKADVTLQTRITKEKGYKYTEFVCRDCGATRQFGKYQDGSGFFLKDWEEKWEGDKDKKE